MVPPPAPRLKLMANGPPPSALTSWIAARSVQLVDAPITSHAPSPGVWSPVSPVALTMKVCWVTSVQSENSDVLLSDAVAVVTTYRPSVGAVGQRRVDQGAARPRRLRR